MARKVGRPTKYDPVKMLPILQQLAEYGCFTEAIPAELGISKNTLYEWLNPDAPNYAGIEFGDAVKAVEAARDRRLMRNLLEHIETEAPGNSSALIFALKNTIGWRDRIETENKHEVKGDVAFTWGSLE